LFIFILVSKLFRLCQLLNILFIFRLSIVSMSKKGGKGSSAQGRGPGRPKNSPPHPSVPSKKMANASAVADPLQLMLYGYNQFSDAIQDVCRSYSGYLTDHVLGRGTAHFIEAVTEREELSIVFIDIATDFLVSHALTDDWKSLVSGFHARLNDTLLQVATGNPDLQVLINIFDYFI